MNDLYKDIIAILIGCVLGLVITMPIFIYISAKERAEDQALCESRGGDYIVLARVALCVPKGTLINIKD